MKAQGNTSIAWLGGSFLRGAAVVDIDRARLRRLPCAFRALCRGTRLNSTKTDRLTKRIQRFRAKQARAKHVPVSRPKRRRHPARSGDLGRYETLKSQWIDAHPSATAAEIGEAVRRIAAACGV